MHLNKANVMVFAIVLGTVLGFLSLAFIQFASCHSSKAPEEYEVYMEALNRRLLEAESMNLKNSLMIHKITSLLSKQLHVLEEDVLEELHNQSKDEAIRLTLMMASYPAPPMPYFDLGEYRDKYDKISNTVNDIFAGYDDEKAEKMPLDDAVKVIDDEHVLREDTSTGMSDEAKRRQCSLWRDEYGVIVGTSWGRLPLNLQEQWINIGCDYFLQR